MDFNDKFLLHNIVRGLNDLFGQSSAAPVDLVESKKAKNRVDLVLSCPLHFVKRLRAGLTLQGLYQGQPCAYTVIQVDKKPVALQTDCAEQRYFI